MWLAVHVATVHLNHHLRAAIAHGGTVDPMRARIGALTLLAGVVALNLVGSMSVTVSTWWGGFANPANHDLPPRLEQMLSLRKDLSEADTHAAMWLAAGIAVLLVAPRRSARLAAIAALFVLSGLVEVAQMTFTTRNAEWGDLIGGGIGLVLAALVGELAALWRHTRRTSRPAPRPAPRPVAGIATSGTNDARRHAHSH